MTLVQIENAISTLPSQDLAALMRWLGEFVGAQISQDAWDKKIAADTASGKLDSFFDEAIGQVQAGQIKDL